MGAPSTIQIWTVKQLKAIELLAGGGMSVSEIQKAVPVSQDTLWRWRKDPMFTDAVLKRSREILRAELPSVYKTLARRARSGQIGHIRALLDHMEHLERSGEQYRGGSIKVEWKATWEEEGSTNQSTES